ncbi:MAG: OmpA family protein [Xenococcaceae cyanobacterium MO_188.B32]|nr:OmpA family protein [Xenococcaceae cyanobacterium MO_188.B32]
MAPKKQANIGNSNNKSETEIQPNLDVIIDLLSELNQVESNQKEHITKKPSYQSFNSQLTLEIKQKKKSAPTFTAHEVRGQKEKSTPTSAAHDEREQEPKDNPLWRQEKSFNSISQQYTTNDNSVNSTNLVHTAQNNYNKIQSIAILQQSVRNLEQKLKGNQAQIDEVIDSVNSLLSLTVELINLQPNGSPQSIIRTISPLIDRIIEQRSTEDLHRMGEALANILPVAINQQIETTPQSIAKALAPEIALSIQEQVRLDKESISKSIGPEMGKAIKAQIELEQDAMVDALYPVIGSTIAKYMGEVINTINEKVENALSIEGVKRKIRAKIQGVSEAELILQEAIPYEVQAIFLIHKASGLIIRELQPDLAHQLESDLLAGMLTAIRSFANDLIAESSELDEIDYGEYKIILEVAGYCYLAVVVKGEPSKQFRQKIRSALSNVVLKYGNIIEVYDGDSDTIPESSELFLEQLLEEDKKQSSSGKPTTLIWFLAVILGLIFVPWGILKYKSYVANRIVQQTAIELDAAPELSVYRLTPEVKEGKLILTGRVPSEYLRNKAAQTVTKIARAEELTLENRIVAINVPIDPTIAKEVVVRVTSMLNHQEEVAILTNYQDYTVTVKGFSLARLSDERIAQYFKQIPGVEKVIINLEKQLPIIDRRIYFASGSLELNSADFTENIDKIRQLLVKYPQLHLRIIGHSDRTGIPQNNQKLAQERANKIAKVLVDRGIESTRLQVVGSIEPPPGVTLDRPLQKSRCVRFEFLIPEHGKNAQNS